MRRDVSYLLGAAASAFSLLLTQPASADRLIIKNPGNHPAYSFEAEPHLLLGFGVPGPADGDGFGLGFRGSVVIVDNGFIKKINNNVAISFGLDWVHYDANDWCDRYWNNGNNCDWDDDADIVWLPVQMQWNFFLSENWSLFGEPGLAFRINDEYYGDDIDLDLALSIGARVHFSDDVALTLRLGTPNALSVGVSFFL